MNAHAQLRIGSILANAGTAVSDRVAVVLGGASLTFGELDRSANQLCRVFTGDGVLRWQRVAVWAAPHISLMPLFGALAKLGAVFVPVNPAATDDELAALLETARPHFLVSDAERAERGVRAAGVAGCLTVELENLMARAAGADGTEPDVPGPAEDDAHVILFTSGSTGRPKGTVLTHRANVLRTHPGSQLEPRGPMVCPYPLFHVSAWTLSLQQWQARDAIIFVKSDPKDICDAIATWGGARINAIPAVWQRILDHLDSPEGAGTDVSTMRYCDTGTSATPLALLESMMDHFPTAQVRVFYGSTEAGAVTALDFVDVRRKPGSCGRPAIWTDLRTGPDGELQVRGPLVFEGYFEDEAATQAAFEDGWFRTGDLAAIDDEGFVSIVGRATAQIRSGGEWVAPGEVEAVLREHPSLTDVAVVGVPHEQWGEVVCAVLVVGDGAAAPGVDELRAHCVGRLANFKHPRAVVVVDAIPRTPATLQIQRKIVVEMAVAALGATDSA